MKRGLKEQAAEAVFRDSVRNIPCPDEKGTESDVESNKAFRFFE